MSAELEHALLMSLRQALLIALGALETYLGLPRSAPPRRARRSIVLRAKGLDTAQTPTRPTDEVS